MNDTTLETVRKFKDGDGNYIWRPGLSQNAPDHPLRQGRLRLTTICRTSAECLSYRVCWLQSGLITIVDHVSGTRLRCAIHSRSRVGVNFYVTKRIAAGISNYERSSFENRKCVNNKIGLAGLRVFSIVAPQKQAAISRLVRGSIHRKPRQAFGGVYSTKAQTQNKYAGGVVWRPGYN